MIKTFTQCVLDVLSSLWSCGYYSIHCWFNAFLCRNPVTFLCLCVHIFSIYSIHHSVCSTCMPVKLIVSCTGLTEIFFTRLALDTLLVQFAQLVFSLWFRISFYRKGSANSHTTTRLPTPPPTHLHTLTHTHSHAHIHAAVLFPFQDFKKPMVCWREWKPSKTKNCITKLKQGAAH